MENKSMNELLLRRAQQGDAAAFEQLLTPLESRIWRICWHYMGERESASDCAQDAMLRIWRSLPSFRGGCAFESWIYRIAASCCLIRRIPPPARRIRPSRQMSTAACGKPSPACRRTSARPWC